MASYNRSYTGPVRINGEYGDGNALGVGAVSYLEKQAFAVPAPYTFGDLPRAAPFGFAAQSLWNQDLSVRKHHRHQGKVEDSDQRGRIQCPEQCPICPARNEYRRRELRAGHDAVQRPAEDSIQCASYVLGVQECYETT